MSEKMMKRMVLGHVEDLMDEIDADDTQRAEFAALAEGIADEALPIFQTVFSQDDNWRLLTQRLPGVGLLNVGKADYEQILSQW